MEMRIWHYDLYKKSKAANGMAIALMFNKGEANDFFNFLEDPAAGIDLTKFLKPDFQMHHHLFGYDGTKTVPPCANGVGWYIVPEIYDISEAQLASIQQHMVPNNYRDLMPITTKKTFSHYAVLNPN